VAGDGAQTITAPHDTESVDRPTSLRCVRLSDGLRGVTGFDRSPSRFIDLDEVTQRIPG